MSEVKNIFNWILVLAIFLAATLSMMAQDDKPIKWSLKADMIVSKANTKFQAKLTAQIGEGWHLYSIGQPEGGPTATTIKLSPNQPFKLSGGIQGPKPEKVYDRNFNMETEFYIEKAEFTLPITATAADAKTLTVAVTFQLCNDEMCLPPDTLEVQTSLGGTVQSNAPTTKTKMPVSGTGASGGLTINSQVPDFAFTDFTGKPRKFSEFKGKIVLIDFWATWCSPCLADIPKLKVLTEKYKTQGLEIIGMDSETLGQDEGDNDPEFTKETTERAKQIVATRGVTWTQADAATAVPIAKQVFGVKSLPTKILIDREGKIVGWLKEGDDITGEVSKLLEAK